MGKGMERIERNILAWGLTLAMVITGIAMPGKMRKVEAAVDYALSLNSSVYTGTSENAGEVVEGITATVVNLSGNSDWAEYHYRVFNGTAETVEGIQIKIPYHGTVDNLQSWGCTVKKSADYIIISHSNVLEAGDTYTCNSDTKFGFSGGASLDSPIVVLGADIGTSSSRLKYELTGQTKNMDFADTPVGKHGKLSLQSVEGYSAPVIVDAHGKPYQLRGASTHGIHWDEMHPYVNKEAFQSLRDEWGVNLVRLASYITQGGYTEGKQNLLDTKIQEGVQAATDLGMYVIIDWHVHAENPHTKKDWAETFFEQYATMYKEYDNVIFEICNEPTGVDWYNGSDGDLYSYCKDIAKIIRDCGSNALIVCGTNTWSQDVDDVAKKPLKEDGFENILYTFHFYSGSHYEDKMKKVRTATAAGTPIFVTEFGICDASGNGGFDTANADAWISLCDENNISFACWSLCNKNESASYLNTSCIKTTGGWVESDLATTGIWLINTYRAHQDIEEGTQSSTGGNDSIGGNGSTGGNDSTGGNSSTGGNDSTGGNTSTSGNVSPNVTNQPGQSNVPVSSTAPSGSGVSQKPDGNEGGKASSDGLAEHSVGLKKVSVKKVTAGKGKLTICWKKVKNAQGYQVCVSKKKNFAKSKKILIKSGKKKKFTVKKLASKKRYFIRVRAWKKIEGKREYSSWSAVKSKKTK